MRINKTIFEQSRAEQSRAEQSSLTALFAYLKILITISSTLQAEEIIRLYVLLFCVFYAQMQMHPKGKEVWEAT